MVKRKTAEDFIRCESKAGTERNYWVTQWQLVAEYVHQRRADFTSTRSPGAFITSNIWTDDPSHMAETSASAFLGYIWSAGVRSFKLKENDSLFKKDQTAKDFFSEATKILQSEMDDQEAGLSVALDESMLEDIVFGTSAILVEERNTDELEQGCLRYEPWSVMEFALEEDAIGRATTFYRRREFTIRQLVEKYGIDNVSSKSRDCYVAQDYARKVKVLHVIEPRSDEYRVKNSKAAKDMPFASVHIEVDNKHVCRESGYPELPVACSRLAKRINEAYGRGRAMNALPSIMQLNQVWEELMLASERKLDPPMYVISDSVTGNGIVDTSSGGITTLRVDKNMPNVPPVGKLYDIQDTNDVYQIIEKIQESISNHFMIDRLINMNNEREMTAREALLRNAIRQSTLRSIVSRILMEKFEPIINSSFMIALRRGKFGYFPNDPIAIAKQQSGEEVKLIPDIILEAMQTGKDLYQIEYMTPAARDLMAEEGQGMIEVLDVAGQMAQFDQGIPDHIDTTWTLSRFAEIRGADSKMFRDKDEVDKIKKARQEQMQQQQQMAMMQAGAGAMRDAAQAQGAVAA
jgi:hypothetical protein